MKSATAPLSYLGLVQRIRAQYAAWGRDFPTPLVEGKYRDRQVLNVNSVPGDSRILLTRDGTGRWTINAGALHGLTVGSILAVSPPPGERDPGQPLGHVRIKPRGLEPLQAEVEPVRYGADPAANPDLPAGGRCMPVFIDFGDLRLGVAVKVAGRADAAGGAGRTLGQRVDRELQAMATDPRALVRKVDSPRPGDWVARVEQDGAGQYQVYLAPASGKVKRDDGVEESSLLGPAPQNDTLGTWLKERLQRIARVTNLLRLVGQGQDAVVEGGAGVDFQVEILKYRDRTDTDGEVVKPGPRGIVLRDGDRIAFRLVNPGPAALDLSLLFIDSNLGIETVFPEPDVVMDNRLAAGRTLTTLSWIVQADKTIGLEHLVVIAVRATKGEPPIDFGWLTQPALERARGDNPRAVESPLGQLLQAAVFGEGTMRGKIRRADRADHVLRLISWQSVR